MLKLKEVVKNITIYTKFETPSKPISSNFGKSWQFEYSIKLLYPCYTLVYKNSPKEFKSKDLVNDFAVPYLLRFELNDQNIRIEENKTLLLFIHDRDTRIDYRDIGFLFFRPRIDTETGIRVTYSLYQTMLKKWPFRTNCQNYQELKYRSQAHCLDVCFGREGQQRLNITMPDILIGPNDRIDMDISFQEDQQVDENMMAELDDLCFTRCEKDDCVHKEFVPAVHDFLKVNGSKIFFSLMAAKQPDILIQAVPAINMVDFLTYVLSTVSFWTGFAPLALKNQWFNSKEKRTKVQNVQTVEKCYPHSLANCMVEINLLKSMIFDLQAKVFR